MINLASTNSSISPVPDQSYVPRIWSGTSVEKVPGCAFTRSLGDIVAHKIGVTEKPEFKQLTIQDGDVIIIASDGVTECKSCGYSSALDSSSCVEHFFISNIFFCFIFTTIFKTLIPKRL